MLTVPAKPTPARSAGPAPDCLCHGKPMLWNASDRTHAGGYWRCKHRYKDSAQRWREANADNRRIYMEQWRAQHKEHMRKSRYGLKPGEYDRMFAEQGGVCAICGATPEQSVRGVLAIDHDHATGRVRGLLCIRCNAALERCEVPGWMARAAEYLAR